MRVGGVDSPRAHGMFVAWTNLRVLARHDDPERASRPFDRDRSGLVLSEAAGMLVLEAAAHARGRDALILGEIAAFGASSDASHITKPSLTGQITAVRNCLEDGGIDPADIDYINAHGTATKANDQTEAEAIQAVFGSRGDRLPVSSSKSMLGHAMGASSALEAIACLQTIHAGTVVPTINCEHPDPDDLGLDFVPMTGRSHPVRTALSNSFGFGGGNCVLALRKTS
jgi:3-oxoacyl-(acyl-carrier-protein) synthase